MNDGFHGLLCSNSGGNETTFMLICCSVSVSSVLPRDHRDGSSVSGRRSPCPSDGVGSLLCPEEKETSKDFRFEDI